MFKRFKEWRLKRQKQKRSKLRAKYRHLYVENGGMDPVRLERECIALTDLLRGLTDKDNQFICSLIPEGEYSHEGDWHTSAISGGMYKTQRSYVINSGHMIHFRPITAPDLPTSWKMTKEKIDEHIERSSLEHIERLNEDFPDIFNNLEILAEECAEIIQVKSKIFRFGQKDVHPKLGKTNKSMLNEEVGQLLAMIDILKANKFLDHELLMIHREHKLKKLKSWYGLRLKR